MWFWKLLAHGKALWLWKQYDHKNNQFMLETVVGVVVLAKYFKHPSCLPIELICKPRMSSILKILALN